MGALRGLALCGLVGISLAGCASRPETGFLATVAPAEGAAQHTILVATTRERDARPGALFNGERAGRLDHASVTVSVPARHKPGQIEWASTAPGDPKSDFTVTGSAYIDGDAAFAAELNRQIAARPPGKRNVVLFIHGYNTLFSEALYRFGQIVHDSQMPAVPVLFTWASRGKVSDYVYDNNSATAARDDLERTIRLLFASGAEQVNILAHSMGNWVTVEALRQVRISGAPVGVSKLGAVILAAPDIDIDVFKSQIQRFGKLRKPYFIVLSKDDKALGISRFIAGDEARVGSSADTKELTKLGAVVIDLTDVKGDDPSNHSKFAQLALIAPQLRPVLEGGIAASPESSSQGQTASGGGLLTNVLTLPIKIIRGN